MMKQLLITVSILILIAAPVLAETGTAGQVAPVLRFGVGARGFGLGGAYGVIADDATAVYWNPAGLSKLEAPTVTTMHAELFLGTAYDYLGWATPLKNGGLGVSILKLSTPGIVLTDGNVSEAAATAAFVGYGRELGGWSLGATIKYLWEDLPTASGNGWGIDLGAQKQVTENYRFGVTIQDIFGSKIKWETGYEETIPVNYRLGVSYSKDKLLLAAEIEKAADFIENHIGFEFAATDFLKLRGGFRGNDFAAGVGLAKGPAMVDYAYCGSELGNTHRLSLTYHLKAAGK